MPCNRWKDAKRHNKSFLLAPRPGPGPCSLMSWRPVFAVDPRPRVTFPTENCHSHINRIQFSDMLHVYVSRALRPLRPARFRIMSSGMHTSPSQRAASDAGKVKASEEATPQKSPNGINNDRSLPAPGSEPTISLDVSGEGSTVKLDALGPLVVNRDGTVARVSNWQQMTEAERETTLRILGKRNKQRLEALRADESGK